MCMTPAMPFPHLSWYTFKIRERYTFDVVVFFSQTSLKCDIFNILYMIIRIVILEPN